LKIDHAGSVTKSGPVLTSTPSPQTGSPCLGIRLALDAFATIHCISNIGGDSIHHSHHGLDLTHVLRSVPTIVSHDVSFVVMILRVNLTVRNELI